MITREFRRAVEQAVSNMMGLPRFVPLATPLTSTSFDGDSFSTTGYVLIDLSSVFGVPAGVKAVLVQAQCRDSGSAAATDLYLALGPDAATTLYFNVRLQGLPNDSFGSETAVVPCNADGDLYYRVQASGTNTMDVWMRILGYWI